MSDRKVYTRGGDTGETSMLSGERVSKTDPHIVAVGELDELSVALGFARLAHPIRNETLKDVQKNLYQLSAYVSYMGDKHAERFELDPGAVDALESLIDDIQDALPQLKDFIYPGLTEAGCRLHQARVVARRTERILSALPENKRDKSVPYINRLSDLLFVIAREADQQYGEQEQTLRSDKKK